MEKGGGSKMRPWLCKDFRVCLYMQLVWERGWGWLLGLFHLEILGPYFYPHQTPREIKLIPGFQGHTGFVRRGNFHIEITLLSPKKGFLWQLKPSIVFAFLLESNVKYFIMFICLRRFLYAGLVRDLTMHYLLQKR